MPKKNTPWGKKAYLKTRKNGGSKEEARDNRDEADKKYHDHIVRSFDKYKDNSVPENHEFDSPLNDGRWHDSNDL